MWTIPDGRSNGEPFVVDSAAVDMGLLQFDQNGVHHGDRPAVKDVAGRMGVDLRQAKHAVITMNAEQLAQVAAQAKSVDQALAGGASNVVISTTTIIIALLVVILIIVAVD
jgi:hypothetical protein